MSLVRATRVAGEILSGPGLQFFPSEAEFEGERVALLQHRQSMKWVPQVGIAASAFIPYVGPAIAAALKQEQSSVDRGIQEDWAALADESAVAMAAPPAPSPQELVMFEGQGFDWGSTIAGLTNAALNYRAQRAQTAAVSGAVALPGGVPVAAQNVGWFPALPSLGTIGRSLIPGGAAVGAVIARGGRAIATAIGNISRKRVVAIAKTLGIQAAATALGIGAVEIAQMVLDDAQRRRGRGGITGAQMRTTRRTIGKVERLHRQIVAACSSARVPSRRRPPAHHFHPAPAPKVIVARR